MLAVVSPAKKLNMEDDAGFDTHTQPDFLNDSEILVEQARKLKAADLSRLMKISDSLANLNVARFKDFETPFHLGNSKQAALCFAGDTYIGLDATTLTQDDFTYAQDHFRILSGLYGLLRPLDLMQAYRLEMGTKFINKRGADLYDFWGTRLSKALDDAVKNHKEPVIINCASNEYFKAVDKKSLNAKIITPIFKEIKEGQAKTLGMFAKRARGMMARYMIQERIDTVEGLKDFQAGGYSYRDDLSEGNDLVFTRQQPAKK